MLVIPATWEVEIRKIVIHHQARQKVSAPPISTNKPGVVVHRCNLSYAGHMGRRITV
jgi:hypothetical protein